MNIAVVIAFILVFFCLLLHSGVLLLAACSCRLALLYVAGRGSRRPRFAFIRGYLEKVSLERNLLAS